MQTDAYQETGCYNLLCSGFVQTDNRIAIGAAISPISASNGGQFDIDLLVWKVTILLPINSHSASIEWIIKLNYRTQSMGTGG